MRNRILTTLITIFFSLTAIAQTGDELLDNFLKRAKGHRISAEYEYVIEGVTDVTVGGTVLLQDNCFRMEGAGLMIFCDSENIWTLDLDGKEAYIEKAGPFDYMKYASGLTMAENGEISGTYGEPISGAIIPFIIRNIKVLPWSGDRSAFTPSSEVLNGDWIITDLR